MKALFHRDPNSPERLKRIPGRAANRRAQEAIGMEADEFSDLLEPFWMS